MHEKVQQSYAQYLFFSQPQNQHDALQSGSAKKFHTQGTHEVLKVGWFEFHSSLVFFIEPILSQLLSP